jgi:hypothetical protein
MLSWQVSSISHAGIIARVQSFAGYQQNTVVQCFSGVCPVLFEHVS